MKPRRHHDRPFTIMMALLVAAVLLGILFDPSCAPRRAAPPRIAPETR